MIPYALIFLALVAAFIYRERQHDKERESFGEERQQWVRERRDLTNKIVAPEAAPFLLEDQDEDAADNDLPVLPEFVVDEAELEKARQHLAEVGYEEGPAL